MSDAKNQDIRIEVESQFLKEHSTPARGTWVFAYEVNIFNDGDEPVQLISRHWFITDGRGNTEEVKGPGVVGQQPRLAPGESFSYTSFCPLPTDVGTMHGTYQMVTEGGHRFDAVIDTFVLAAPHAFN